MREGLVGPTAPDDALSGFARIIGQKEVVKRVQEFARLYVQSGNPAGHILVLGDDGCGKRTLARAFADEYHVKCIEVANNALERAGDLMGILTNLNYGDVLFIDEIHRLPANIEDFLHAAMEDFKVDFVVDKGMFAKTINVPLRRFTCLATASSRAKVPVKLLELFPLVVSLQDYSDAELASLCVRLGNERGMSIAPAAAPDLVAATEKTPHAVEVLLRRMAGLGKHAVSVEDLGQLSPVLGLTTSPDASPASSTLDTLSGVEFERAIASLLRVMGFCTQVTKASGDGGIDIVATLDRPLIGGRFLIQCKRFAPGNLVGASTVRDFYGALTADRNAIKGILITTSGFTSQALAFARNLPIELIGGDQLRRLLANPNASPGTQTPPGSAQTLFEEI